MSKAYDDLAHDYQKLREEHERVLEDLGHHIDRLERERADWIKMQHAKAQEQAEDRAAIRDANFIAPETSVAWARWREKHAPAIARTQESV